MTTKVITGKTQVIKIVYKNKTIIKKATMGVPVRRVVAPSLPGGAGNINTIGGVDTSSKENGSVLVFKSSSGNFEATRTLEQQYINGGQY